MGNNLIRLLSAALGTLALIMTACAPSTQAPAAPQDQDKPRHGGVFLNRFGAADPASFDLHADSLTPISIPIGPTFDLLVRFAPQDPGMVVPDLAEKWEYSADGKTLTFTIRKGVKFHNGDELTSADIKFTLDRNRGAITQGPGKPTATLRKDLFTAIESINTPDDSRVVLQLKYPTASLLGALANGYHIVMDKKWVEAGHDPKKEVNGTGPFKFKEFISGVSVELTRNDQYWNEGLPYLDGVKTYVVPDANTSLAAVRTGQQMMMSLNGSQQETLTREMEAGKLTDTLTLRQLPVGSTSLITYMNTTKKPFDDVRVRRAFAMSMDWNEWGQLTRGSGGQLAGFLTPGFWALPPEELAKMPGFRPDKAAERAEAKKLLADAGYPSGLAVKVMIARENAEDLVPLGAQFKNLGVTLEADLQEANSIYDRALKGDYQMASRSRGHGPDPDGIYGYAFHCGAGGNFSLFCDPKADELDTKQTQTLDPEARRKIVWELEKYILQQAPMLPMGYAKGGVWAINKQVRNHYPHPIFWNNQRLDAVWLAP